MKTTLSLALSILCAASAFAATAVQVSFTLNTTDKNGAPITQSRSYSKYRPDGYPTSTPLPAILLMETGITGSANAEFLAKADQFGIVIVTCAIAGNSSGSGWVNDDPRWVGYEDYDYVSAVISRVAASDNCNDFFICGLSKAGHMSYAFACERPSQIKAACCIDEFMQQLANIPQAPVPLIIYQGTGDVAVSYAMARDSVDEWRAMNGVTSATPVTTFESSPLMPGNATQTTWRGGTNGTQVAFVTLIGGTHSYPTADTATGYNIADGVWAFFRQFLTPSGTNVRIVSQPVTNKQVAGQPASFWVAATGAAPITYQWQKNGADVVGATSNLFTTPPTTLADNGATYRVVVTNGSGSVTSSSATLTVSAPPSGPAITTPPANVSVTAGQGFTFSVSASGAGSLSYQWQKDGMNIVGATAASYSGSLATPTESGSAYRVLVTDSTGTTASIRATLTVTPAQNSPII